MGSCRTEQYVPVGIGGCIVVGEQPGRNQTLYNAVIFRHFMECAAAKPIQARVTPMGPDGLLRIGIDAQLGDGGTHVG